MKKILLSLFVMVLCAFGLVACGGPSDELLAAGEYLDQMYLNAEVVDGKLVAKASETPDDYEVINKVIGLGKVFDIVWSIEMIEGNEADVVLSKGEKATVIIIDEKSEVVAKYYLKAVITEGKQTIEKKYEKVKPAYQLMTWAEVQAAKDDSIINAKGVITGIVGTSSLNIYFENEQGGYYIYAYKPSDDIKAKLVVGATIEVSGTKDTYNGLVEFTSSTVNVLDDAIATVTPKDVTAIFEAATATTDKTLTDLISQYVTIKGVKMKDISSDGKYLNFTLAGKESYVYISSSSNMVTTEEITALKEKVVENMEANITGMVALYSGKFYIIPNTVDSIELIIPELTDAEKVADAKEKVLALNNTTAYSDLDLFTTTVYEGVTVAWTSEKVDLIANTGKVTAPAEDTAVKLTAVITAGSATETVEVTVTVAAVTRSTIAEVNQMFGTEQTVCIYGKVIETYNKGKGSFIADETGVAYLYTKLPDDIKVGDSVKLIATTKVWDNNGKEYTRQLTTLSIEKLEQEINVLKPSKVDLNEIVDKMTEDGTMTDELKTLATTSPYYGRLYEFTGYVVEHAFGSYTNYGLSLTEDGTTFVLYQYQNEYQDEFKALKGKKVTLVAPMYGFSAQYGWRIGTYVEIKEAGETETTTLPTAKNSVAETKILAKDTPIELIGVVACVYDGSGFYVQDGTGTIFVYVKGDTSAYKVGDIVKVTGKAGFYRGPQVTNTDLQVEKLSDGTFTSEAVEMTIEEFLALDPADLSNYGKEVIIVGSPVVSGKYVNLQIAEGKTSNLYMNDAQKAALTELVGKQIKVKAFTYQQNSSYPFGLVLVSYEEVPAE